MSKNIVICCDGTGNQYGDRNSNVVKLYSTLIIDENNQIGYYHPGVGTMGSPTAHNKVSEAWSTLMGLAFGSGLLANVGDAYRYLMNSYEAGDRVYLFGFSRGAYTVRALSGVLHMFGLLCPGNEGLIPYVIRMYARRTRKAGGMTHTFSVAAGFKQTFCRHCPIHFVGVWDTVSSVGWIWNPVRLPYTAQNPDVQNGRHAVSIDERRCYFRDNLWGPALPGQTIKQVWFAGVHSDVGGSYPEMQSGLSQVAFQWMLDEAVQLNLIIDPAVAAQALGRIPPPPPVAPNPLDTKHESLTKAWWLLEFLPHSHYDKVTGTVKWRIPLGKRRFIPDGSVLHESAAWKISQDISYRPKNLPDTYLVDTQPLPSKFPLKLNVGQSHTLQVRARVKWQDTGILLSAGEVYQLAATGQWNDASIKTTPDGYKSPSVLFQMLQPLRRCPTANWFALVGSVGRTGSLPFLIGTSKQLAATENGVLYCFANDLPFMYWNNSGAIRMLVTRIR